MQAPATAGDKGQQWIAQLFKAIDGFEESPTTFDADAFIELYGKVERAIELSGESEAQAYQLDQALFNAVSLADVDQSPLRMVVSHALTIHHRYHADYGRGFEQAYKWCEQSRVQAMPDLRYVHTYLLPPLVKGNGLGGNLDLSLFLLERLARFENLEKSPVWEDERALELVREAPGDIAYQLARRRVMYIAENLTKVPNSLEQRLHKDGAFKEMFREHGESNPVLAHELRMYEYLSKDPWWQRVRAGLAAASRGLVERMAGEYIAYEMTKRNGAFIVQGLLMALIVLGLAMALFGWAYKNNQRLDSIETDLSAAHDLIQSEHSQIVNEAEDLRYQLGGQ